MTTVANQNEEISLYSLFSLLLEKWYILLSFAAFFGIVAIVWAIYQPNYYKATVLMMPAESSQSAMGNLGGLAGMASLAGVSLPGGSKDEAKFAIEMMKSYRFLSEFIEENDLLIPIMAVNDWDMASNKLLIDENVYSEQSKQWVRNVKAPFKAKPSLQEAHKEFLKLLEIEQDPETKFYNLSVEYYSPEISAQWANALVAKLNVTMRAIDKKESAESIVYLERLIVDTHISELRKVFSVLMEEEVKSQMLAELKKEYSMKVIDPAISPELKSKPKRLLIGIVVAFLGGILGVIVVFVRAGKK